MTADMKGLTSRRVAVEVLMKVELEGAFANLALAAAFKKRALIERDRAFATALVHGSTRHAGELDLLIEKYSKRSISKLTPALRAVLRSAFFQLIHMEDIPASAVVNTAVQLGRQTGHEGSAKFVNAILRAYKRDFPSDSPSDSDGSAPSSSSSSSSSPSSSSSSSSSSESSTSSYSLPEWLVEKWKKRFGEEESNILLKQTQEIPRLTLRTCESGITPEGLERIFTEKGMKVARGKLVPACITILHRGSTGGPVSKLPGYSDGLFTVQDEAAAFVSIVLDPKPGQTILDLCAAPGGKAVHLGEMMENKGRVVAADISQKRLDLIAPERRRLSLTNVETVQADGRKYAPGVLFDAILIDAPCTGTGVINRKADLRQRRKELDVAELVSIQRDLLNNSAKLLKPGGTLVYSTCSIEAEENVENVDAFLEAHQDFRAEALTPYLNPEILILWQNEAHWNETAAQIESGKLQLLPSRHFTSGFFIARLRKEIE